MERRLDEAPVGGGAYRVGNRVVDSNGKDLGEEGVTLADKIDKDSVAKAKKDHERVQQEMATKASGGLANVLARAFGAGGSAAMRDMPVTEVHELTEEELAGKAGSVSAATLTGAPGPTPVAVASTTRVAPEATDSPADELDDAEDVLKRNEEASAASASTPAGGTRKKGGTKKG